MKYILLTFIWLSISCHSQRKTVDVGSQPDISELKSDHMELLFEDNYGGGSKKELQIIQKKAALEAVYAKINRTKKPGIPVPNIDFTTHMVVFYNFGEIKGTVIPVLRIIGETDKTLRLTLSTKESVSNETNITAPFCIYKLPITTKRIVLKELH